MYLNVEMRNLGPTYLYINSQLRISKYSILNYSNYFKLCPVTRITPNSDRYVTIPVRFLQFDGGGAYTVLYLIFLHDGVEADDYMQYLATIYQQDVITFIVTSRLLRIC